jgi:hypothetical protein
LRRHAGQISRRRRLDQRGATALARRLAGLGAPAIALRTDQPLPAALAQAVAARTADPTPVEPAEAGDWAVILRAAVASGAMARPATRALSRRLVAEGALQGAWLLPIKLWLGR